MSEIIVTIAPTGGMATKAQNPNLPTQPEEIAADVAQCRKAGAAIAALHVRRGDDQATCNPDIYRRVNALVRERCDIILNNSTGGGSDGDMIIARPDGRFEADFEERLKGLDGGAEMATFDGFTVTALHQGRELIVVTSPGQCDRMAEKFRATGIKPEWEVFSPAHIIQDVTRLIGKGYDKPPYYINMVLGADRGFQGAMPYSHDILAAMIRLLPPQSIFCVSAIGPAQLPATTQAILLGGHIRVGLEDNNYYARGQLATNLSLVERSVRILTELGHTPATPHRAREMLGLPQPAARVAG